MDFDSEEKKGYGATHKGKEKKAISPMKKLNGSMGMSEARKTNNVQKILNQENKDRANQAKGMDTTK